MSWGVATQNGVSVSLASIVSLSAGVTEFSPADLFTGGVQGAWYDPSDYSTLFQDSAGTTPVTAVEQPVGLMRDKSGNNNHALQATAASRPVLRARYNQLTYSEQFDNAAWTKTNFNAFGSGSTANTTATTDPIGGNTADFLQLSTAANVIHHALIQPFTSASIVYTQSVYFKAAGYSKVGLREGVTTGAYATADLSTGNIIASGNGASGAFCTSVGNGWYRVGFTFTSGAAPTSGVQVFAMDSGYTSGSPAAYTFTANGTDGVYIWGAQLVTGSSAGTYQRIAAATDYATAGFLPYLYFVTDDSFGTNSINFSATDKMSVCAGVTKLSDAAAGIVAELSTNWNTNAGSFIFTAPSAAAPTNDINFGSRGSAAANLNQGVSLVTAAPTTKVISALNDITASTTLFRSNGADVGTASGTKGTGNFGNYPLFIGRRNNATVPFEGRIYGLIVCGKALSASELSATESWMNSRTGAY